MKKVNGSLHSHGCWTYDRSFHERLKFPFKVEDFARWCISCGRDFQSITDIMAHNPGKKPSIEDRYDRLMQTADPNARYEFQYSKRESIIAFPDAQLTIPRSQEIVTDKSLKHVLAIGAQENIPGGENARKTLQNIKDAGGYTVIDHPFLGNVWQTEELVMLYEDGLVQAIEWNGGLTLPSFLARLMKWKIPSRACNKRALNLDGIIPVIANDDAHSQRDIEKGAYTTYSVPEHPKPLVDRVFDAIRMGTFRRHENYSPFLSPLKHVFYGNLSQLLHKEQGLPSA